MPIDTQVLVGYSVFRRNEMEEIPGYDDWKLRSPEEEEDMHKGRLSRREWEEENADYLYDSMRDREFEDDF